MADVKLNEATAVTTLGADDLIAVIPSEATGGDTQAAAALPEGINKANLATEVAGEIEPVRWRGDYDAATTYSRLDLVRHDGGLWLYVAAASASGVTPVAGTTWATFRGPAGADGQQGERGDRGPTGPHGLQGPQGHQGPVGPVGPAGQSIVGPAGPRGERGPPGDDGDDGAQGPIGPMGPAGADGVDGQDGARGPVGPQGLPGTPGAPGAPGEDGQDGQDGAQGPQGDTGARGPVGPQGLPGQPGATGPVGPAGPAAAGSPTPRDFLGATDLAHGVNGLILNAGGWKNYDYLNIVIIEESASEATPNRVHNLTGSMLDVGFLKATTPADTVAYGTMVNTEVCSFRGETTTASNRYFYLARTATDEDNKLRLSANAAINVSSGTTQVIEVRGLRVGASNWKGTFSAEQAYGQGDVVLSGSEMWIAMRDVAASTTAPAEGEDWSQISGGGSGGTPANIAHAFRPAVAGAINDVRGAAPGWHVVGPGTSNLPSGVVVGAGEAALKVEATDQAGGEHRLLTLVIVNRQTSGSATTRQVWQTLQDGPANDAASYSAWRRIDNPLTAAHPVLSATAMGVRNTAADGTDITHSVEVPTALRGSVASVEIAAASTILTLTYKDATGAVIGTDTAEIALPVLSASQWDRTADNPETYLTSEAVISPSKLAGTITRQRPQGTNAAADAGEDVAVYYGWSPSQLHRGARAALPVVTLASVSLGTSSALKSVSDAALKEIVETLGGGSGGGGGASIIKIGTTYDSDDSSHSDDYQSQLHGTRGISLQATAWADYIRLQIIVFGGGGVGAFVTQFFPIQAPTGLPRVGHDATSPPGDHSFTRIEDTTGEFWAVIAPQSLPDDSSASDPNALRLMMSGDLPATTRRIEVWAISAAGSEAVVASAAPFVTYGHANAPEINGRYSAATIYGNANDPRASPGFMRHPRKFVIGDVYASSNDGNGLPSSAGLTWHTGDRDGVDHEAGENSTSALIDGTVFSLSGTWRITVSVTLDNWRSQYHTLTLEIRKVNASGGSDDVTWVSRVAAAGGDVGGPTTTGYVQGGTTDPRFRDHAYNARLVTPLLNFDGDDRYYVSWHMSNAETNQNGNYRLSEMTLSFEKRGA